MCQLSENTKLIAALRRLHPWQVQKLTSLSIFEREFLLDKNVATAWNHEHPHPKMYILVHFWAASLQEQTCYCVEPPPSMASSKIDLLVNFWMRVFARQKRRNCVEPRTSPPKNVHPCSFLGCKFAGANLLLRRTTAIRGGSDTLRISRSNVLPLAKLASLSGNAA